MELDDYFQKYWDSFMEGRPKMTSRGVATRQAQDLMQHIDQLDAIGPVRYRNLTTEEGTRTLRLLESMNALEDHYPDDLIPLAYKAKLVDVLQRTGQIDNPDGRRVIDELQEIKLNVIVSALLKGANSSEPLDFIAFARLWNKTNFDNTVSRADYQKFLDAIDPDSVYFRAFKKFGDDLEAELAGSFQTDPILREANLRFKKALQQSAEQAEIDAASQAISDRFSQLVNDIVVDTIRRKGLPDPALANLNDPAIRRIEFQNLAATRGGMTSPEAGVLILNNTVRGSQLRLLSSIFHESRHAVQRYLRDYTNNIADMIRKGDQVDPRIMAVIDNEIFNAIYDQTRLVASNFLSRGGAAASNLINDVVRVVFAGREQIAGMPAAHAIANLRSMFYVTALNELDAHLAASRMVVQMPD